MRPAALIFGPSDRATGIIRKLPRLPRDSAWTKSLRWTLDGASQDEEAASTWGGEEDVNNEGGDEDCDDGGSDEDVNDKS